MGNFSEKRKVLITAALPYANGPLHFGHITGAYLPGDCYARFRRLLGDDVLYICGSDEYGIAITIKAEQEGIPFQQYVDFYHAEHKRVFERLQISFDHFSRTTNQFHQEFVCQFYQDLLKNGFIVKKRIQQLYSEEEGRFLADRYVEGECPRCGFEEARGDECQRCGASYEATDLKNPRSKLTGSALKFRETEHSFLELHKFKDLLKDFVSRLKIKAHSRNFVLDYIEHLRERAITRDLSWGIPVPGEEGKVFYVWFDAPIGYISATKEWGVLSSCDEDLWKDYWLDPSVEYVQFLGKDNVPFHAVIFPAMQLGQDIPYKRADALVASEFYLLEGKQFSKSDGNYIDLEEFIEKCSVDQIRYVLAATSPESSDSEFTFEDFKTRCNSELVGKFGNFFNRALSFAKKNDFFELRKPAELSLEDESFLKQVAIILEKAKEAYSEYSLRRATSLIMELAALGNTYFNDRAPWKELKSGDRRGVEKTLFCTCFCQKLLALIASPIMPASSEKILRMLGRSEASLSGLWTEDFTNYQSEREFVIGDVDYLFSVIE